MKDTALLVVSFGTSYVETREKTIGAIEKDMEDIFPEADVKRAFTSGMIIKILKERDHIYVNNVEEAMHEIVADGYKKVWIQPTHIINGEEYEKMMAMLQPFRDIFDEMIVGKPLLTCSDDYDKIVEIITEEIELKGKNRDRLLVLMGHGTGHFTDAAYAALDYRFKAAGYSNVFVATVEGYPSFEDIIDSLEKTGKKDVILTPFMIVCGDHAVNDMAGNEDDSWKNILERRGFSVECVLKGIGEYKGVRKMYIDHLKDVIM